VSAAAPRVLVAGVGNVFLRDDGFGVAVVERLATRPVPDGVHVVDYGIRGTHLAYDLLDGCDVLLLIDAVPMGAAPGTLAVVEPDRPAPGARQAVVDAHGMTPDAVLGLVARLGGSVERVLVVGCEPADVSLGTGLSAPVAAMVEPAVETVLALLAELCGERREEKVR
jgi:hydrogenase maturation protease